MAQKPDISPDNLARKTFLLTVVGALIYIAVVFTFIIGGNRREEAAEAKAAEQAAEQAPGQMPADTTDSAHEAKP